MLLLSTKLNPPIEPQHILVQRKTLLAKLANFQTKFVVFCAGAGYGKSTTVLQWLQAQARPFVWLSLDELDNNSLTFWRYILAAYQMHDASLGSGANKKLITEEIEILQEVVIRLVNDLIVHPNPPILAIDDYHVISNPLIHDSFSFFLDKICKRLGVIILSRTAPPLQLARRRVRGELIEISNAELNFSVAETKQFLMNMHVEMDDVGINALQTITEGWIAGLKMAGLSLVKTADKHNLIAAFSAHHRDITDYLLDEVFNKQCAIIQTFLLQTAHLPRLHHRLCDAVTLRKDAAIILNDLEKMNLFLIPLDSTREWYRYHDLFKELLFARALQNTVFDIKELRVRAGRWFEQNNYIDEALQQIVALNDWDWAVALLERVGQSVLYKGYFDTVYRWLKLIPKNILSTRPKLIFNLIGGLGNLDQIDEMLTLLDAGEKILCSFKKNDASQLKKMGFETSDEYIKTLLLFYFGQAAIHRLWLAKNAEAQNFTETAHQFCLQHGIKLPADINYDRMMDAFLRGDLPQSLKIAYEAMDLAKAEENVFILCSVMHVTIWTHYYQGNFKECIEIFNENKAWLENHAQDNSSPFLAFYRSPMTIIYRELNDPQQAKYFLDLFLEYLHRNPVSIWLKILIKKLELSYYQSFGDLAKASQVLQDLQQIQKRSTYQGTNHGAASVGAYAADLALRLGDMQTAHHWADEQRGLLLSNSEFHYEMDRLILAKVLRAQCEYETALRLLNDIRAQATPHQRLRHIILSYIMEALIYYDQNKLTQAMQAFSMALLLAEPCGFVRIFLDEPDIQYLLNQALAMRITPDYTQRLIRAFAISESVNTIERFKKVDKKNMLLSSRELTILQLINEGLSNKLIAKKLFVTEGTIKTHNHHIYEKLGVANRTQAIQKARQLGFLN